MPQPWLRVAGRTTLRSRLSRSANRNFVALLAIQEALAHNEERTIEEGSPVGFCRFPALQEAASRIAFRRGRVKDLGSRIGANPSFKVENWLMLSALIALLILNAAPAGLPPEAQSRAKHLESILLAPCCWNEPISVHRSEVATQMKLEVGRMIAAGRSDREILDHYKQQYGARVLIEPEGNTFLAMNAVPWLAALFGLILVMAVLRRMLRPAAPAAS